MFGVFYFYFNYSLFILELNSSILYSVHFFLIFHLVKPNKKRWGYKRGKIMSSKNKRNAVIRNIRKEVPHPSPPAKKLFTSLLTNFEFCPFPYTMLLRQRGVFRKHEMKLGERGSRE